MRALLLGALFFFAQRVSGIASPPPSPPSVSVAWNGLIRLPLTLGGVSLANFNARAVWYSSALEKAVFTTLNANQPGLGLKLTMFRTLSSASSGSDTLVTLGLEEEIASSISLTLNVLWPPACPANLFTNLNNYWSNSNPITSISCGSATAITLNSGPTGIASEALFADVG
jgi:hypothetical protein